MGRLLKLAGVLLGVGVLAQADTFTSFPDRATQIGAGATDLIDWSQLGVDGTLLSTPQGVTTFDGNNVLVGNLNLSSFARVDEGASWVGSFDFAETLVATASGPFALDFKDAGTSNVASIGFAIEGFGFASAFAPPTTYSGNVQVFDTLGNLLYTQGFSGTFNNLENGSSPYVGFADLTSGNIGYITISTTGVFANAFAIDDVSVGYAAATPEPGSVALLLCGMLGVAGVVRRMRKKF